MLHLSLNQLQSGPMVNKADALLKVFQNNNNSIELVVRESIQNALDARSLNQNPVKMEFNILNVNTSVLNHFAGNLHSHFRHFQNTFNILEIRDNGKGLEGDLTQINQDKNLQRLVYQIGQSHQTQNQQGGSWGYGKTVYYRLGKGFVIFYSRIETTANNYEERLVACLVDKDPQNPYNPSRLTASDYTGICWWAPNLTNSIAFTNPQDIATILTACKIKHFQNNETGTSIVIPFIDDQQISSIIESQVMKWYHPRLNNQEYTKYNHLPHLEVSINGTVISLKNQYFNIYKDLYNETLDHLNMLIKNKNHQIPKYNNKFFIPININKTFDNSTLAGCLGILKTDLSPRQKDALYKTLKNKPNTSNLNDVVFLARVRKPGMIIDYDVIKSVNHADVVIAIFIPYSNQKFDPNLFITNLSTNTFDDYLRLCEMADHMTWTDEHLLGIIKKIDAHIDKEIRKYLNPNLSNGQNLDVALSEELGKIFNIGGNQGKQTKTNKNKSSTGNKLFDIKYDLVEYDNQKIIVPIKLTKQVKSINVELLVSTHTSKYSEAQWNGNDGQFSTFPLKIIGIEISSTNNTKTKTTSTLIPIQPAVTNYTINDNNNFDEIKLHLEHNMITSTIDLFGTVINLTEPINQNTTSNIQNTTSNINNKDQDIHED